MGTQDEQNSSRNSLLRRMLNQEQEARPPEEPIPTSPEDDIDPARSPVPGYNVPARPSDRPGTSDLDDVPRSPIRPTMQDESVPQDPLTPQPPRTGAPPPLTPREQMQRAEEALINLRQKMSHLAADFADGQLNRDQFEAIYARYSEQRDITERLLARDPESQAWQSVVQAGHTQFLKDHYAARVLSYGIYAYGDFRLIALTGNLQISRGHVEAVLKRLASVMQDRGQPPGPALKRLGDGRYVTIMPGQYSAAVVIYSREPADGQVSRVSDIHDDFERANQQALEQHDYTPERLVYPHRALFEENRF